jgi:hypothetical protein
MAVRISSDASVVKRTANLPSGTSFTMCGWFKFVTATPARFWGAMGMMSAVDGTAGRTVASTTSGGAQLALEYSNSGGSFVTDALLTVTAGTWYFIALTASGTAIGTVAAYIRAQHEKTFTSVTNSAACNALTPGAMEWGREGFTGEFMDGDAFALCAFDTALTSRELLLLSNDLLAENAFARNRPNVYFRLRGSNDTWDRSGNARHPTLTAGVDRPGFRVFQQSRNVFSSPGAGGDVTLALTGQSLASSAGTLIPTLSIPLTGQALSIAAGTLTSALARALSGQVLASSTGTLIPSMAPALSGTALASAAGTLTPALSLPLSGSALTASIGTLVPTLSIPLSGLLITIGQGSLTAPGSVTAALTGIAIAVSQGTLVPNTSKALAGSVLTMSLGTMLPATSKALTGSTLASAQGSIGPALTVLMTGSVITASSGTIAVFDPSLVAGAIDNTRIVRVTVRMDLKVRASNNVLRASAPKTTIH